MRRNYSTNNYRSLRESTTYRSGLLNESVYDDAFMSSFEERFGEEGMSADMKRLAKALGIAATIIKRQPTDEQVQIMQAVLEVFEENVAKGTASAQLARSVKKGDYRFEQPEEEPKMESRYRSGSRLNESRRSVQRPNRRYNY